MLRAQRALALLGIMLFVACAAKGWHPRRGEAVSLPAETLDGTPVTLGGPGPIRLVHFWATWCTPCRREMPMLSGAQAEFRKDGLIVIHLSLEEPDVLEAFLRTNHFDGVQGRLAKADDYYRAGKIYPLSYLISRDGHVSKRWSGRPAENWLRESIREEL